MKYTQLTKSDKLYLTKITNEKTTIKNLNTILKNLFKQSGIKTLRKFSNTIEIFNKLYPTIKKSPYEILSESVKHNKDLKSEKSRAEYNRILTQFKEDYSGGLNINELTKYVENALTINIGIKFLHIVVRYFKENNMKTEYDHFFNLRDSFYKQINGTDKGAVFNGQKEEDYIQLLNKMDDDKWKLILTLMVKYPCLRISDYHTLKIGEGENYISKDFKKVIFSKIVKVKIDKPIIINLKQEDQELFKKVIGEKTGDLFEVSFAAYKKAMERRSKKYFNLIPHNFRRLSYLKLKDQIKEFKDIADNQGHSMDTILKYYV